MCAGLYVGDFVFDADVEINELIMGGVCEKNLN